MIGRRLAHYEIGEAYMASEQAEGRAADARTDLYSFGSMPYEILSLRRSQVLIGARGGLPLTEKGRRTTRTPVQAGWFIREPSGFPGGLPNPAS